jgi:hypothetical protein
VSAVTSAAPPPAPPSSASGWGSSIVRIGG